jgi:hypothetical protein
LLARRISGTQQIADEHDPTQFMAGTGRCVIACKPYPFHLAPFLVEEGGETGNLGTESLKFSGRLR